MKYALAVVMIIAGVAHFRVPKMYEQIVPRLSLAIAPQLPALGHELDREGLDLAYQLTLRVFFRLLFQAYAEDRKLLPFGENPRYDRNALNTLASDLANLWVDSLYAPGSLGHLGSESGRESLT